MGLFVYPVKKNNKIGKIWAVRNGLCRNSPVLPFFKVRTAFPLSSRKGSMFQFSILGKGVGRRVENGPILLTAP